MGFAIFEFRLLKTSSFAENQSILNPGFGNPKASLYIGLLIVENPSMNRL